MQALSKLIRPNSILKTQSFSKSRSGFYYSYCSKISQQQKNNNDAESIKQIASILNNNNQDDWLSRLKSCDVDKLFHFFTNSCKKIWWEGTSQNQKSFLIISICLCDSYEFLNAFRVLELMIETRNPQISDVIDAMTSVELTSAVFTQLIYAYKNRNMLNEAVSLLLCYKNADCFPKLACLNSLMNDLLKKKKLRLFWKVYDRLVEANVTPNVYTYTNVIKAYCRCGKMEDAKRVFCEMEEKNCSPNLVTYYVLIGGLCRYGLVNEAVDYMKLMTKKGLIPNEYTYRMIIDRLFKANRSSDAQLVLDDMNKAGLGPDHVTYSIVINGFMREGKIDEALSMLYEMVAKNCEPRSTLSCINNLMKELLKQNKMESFWNVYEKMLANKVLSPDDYTCRNLIGGYVRDGKVDEARKLFSGMGKKGCNPSLGTHNVFISGLCKTGLVVEAFKLKRSMEKTGLKPNIYTYTNLIVGLCKLKKPHDAKLLIEEMALVNLAPNCVTYNALINGFLKQGEVDEAFKLKDEMVAEGVEVNLVTYNCIIDGLCKLGECEKAIKILNNMKKEGVSPDVISYNSLIVGLCNMKRMVEARESFTQMVENGVKPNVFSYSYLISGFIKQGNLDSAFQLFNDMERRMVLPNIATYNTLIGGLCKMGDIRRARELFDEIPGKGVMVNALSYTIIVRGYCETGSLFEAFRLLDEMRDKGIQADKFVYRALVNGCCKEGDTERGLLLFDRMVMSGFESTPTFNTLIDGFSKLIQTHCKSGMIKEAEHLLTEMKMRKLSPTIEAYTSLLHSYIRSGEKSKIFTIVEDLIELGTPKSKVSYMLLDGFSEECSPEKSFKLWDELVAKELCCRSVFDRSLYFFCHKGKFCEALACIDEVKKRGVTVRFDTCKDLIVGLKTNGYDDEVAKVFKKMVKFGWVPGSTSVDEMINQEETNVKIG